MENFDRLLLSKEENGEKKFKVVWLQREWPIDLPQEEYEIVVRGGLTTGNKWTGEPTTEHLNKMAEYLRDICDRLNSRGGGVLLGAECWNNGVMYFYMTAADEDDYFLHCDFFVLPNESAFPFYCKSKGIWKEISSEINAKREQTDLLTQIRGLCIGDFTLTPNHALRGPVKPAPSSPPHLRPHDGYDRCAS